MRAVLLVVAAACAVAASAEASNGSRTYTAGAGGLLYVPDITQVVIAHDDAAMLSIRVAFANRAAEGADDAVFFYLNTVPGRGIQSLMFSDYLVVVGGSRVELRRWDGTDWQRDVASPTLRYDWSGALTVSIALREIEAAETFTVSIVTVAAIPAGKPWETDLLENLYYSLAPAAPAAESEPQAPAALAAPAGVRATRGAVGLVRVSWARVPDALRYEVWRSTAGSPRIRVGVVTAPSYADRRVVANRRYTYVIRAANSVGRGRFGLAVVGWARGR